MKMDKVRRTRCVKLNSHQWAMVEENVNKVEQFYDQLLANTDRNDFRDYRDDDLYTEYREDYRHDLKLATTGFGDEEKYYMWHIAKNLEEDRVRREIDKLKYIVRRKEMKKEKEDETLRAIAQLMSEYSD